MGQQYLLIPARFMLTMGHLICVVMTYYTIDDNIDAGLGSNPKGGAYSTARYQVRGRACVCDTSGSKGQRWKGE